MRCLTVLVEFLSLRYNISCPLCSTCWNVLSVICILQGQYEIVAMSGSFLNTESNGTVTITGDLSVSLANQNGKIVGGFVAGMLVAASLVQVTPSISLILYSRVG